MKCKTFTNSAEMVYSVSKKIFLYIILMVITSVVFSQNVYVVTKTTDPNPFTDKFDNDDSLCDPDMYGTLQWAINKVNYNGGESRIEFNIPGSAPHEIVLNSYLPQIKQPVIIDAESQPGFVIGSPAIIINGQKKFKSGLDAYYATIKVIGIHIKNFANHGVLISGSNNSEVKNCVFTSIVDSNDSKTPAIGIRIVGSNYVNIFGNNIQTKLNSGNSISPTYGVFIDKSFYCTIGGTNQGEANIIANCGSTGVAVRGCNNNKISGNIIYQNDKAIEMIYNANGGIQPPVIAEYTNGILKGTALPNSTVEVFGSTGVENANEYLESVITNTNGDWLIEVNTNFENFISLQSDLNNNSSTLGNAVLTGFMDNNCLYSEPCNLICNPSIKCENNSECGYMLLPAGWETSHGTCDRCPGVGFLDDRCDYFAAPPDEGFVIMFSDGEENREEGVLANLTNSLIPLEYYRLTFWVQNVGTIDNMTVRLISLPFLVGIVPRPNTDIYVIPDVQNSPFVCRTIDSRHFSIVNPQSWHEITIDFQAENGNENFDALWIYIHNEDNYAFLGIDKFKLEKLSFAETTFDYSSCFNIGQPMQLNAYNPDAVSYTWAGPSWTGNGSNPIVNTHAILENAGEYTLTVTDDNGCEIVSSTNVVVNDLSVQITSPITAYLENEVLLCTNTDLILTATASPSATNPFPYTYSWNNGYINETYYTSEINIYGIPAMTFVVTVTDENGCSAVNDFTVNYYPPIEPPLPTNTGPYCISEDIELTVSNPNPEFEYSWTTSGWHYNVSAPDEEYYEAFRLNAQNNMCCNPDPFTMSNFSGNYTVTVLDQHGCTASATTYVEVAPDQSCLIAESDSPICAGDDLRIELNAGSSPSNSMCAISDSYIIVEGPNGIVDFDLIYNTIYIYDLESSDAGTYTITINSPYNCSSIVLTTDVIVFQNPWVSLAGVPGYFCIGQTLDITPVHSDNILQYTWDGPDYFSHDPVANFTLPNNTSGQFGLSLNVTDYNGCTASATTTLFVQNFFSFDVSASLDSPIPICIGDELNFTTTPDNADRQYFWSGRGFTSTEPNPVFVGVEVFNTGLYIVKVADNYGCTASDEIFVEVIDCDSDIELICYQVPATCRQPYNGAVRIIINNGNPPYIANIFRNDMLLGFAPLDDNGEHFIDLEGIEPDDMPVIIQIIDAFNNEYYSTLPEGLNYAWELVLTNNNLHDQNNYEDIVMAVGDDYENQMLDFHEDFTFTNCTIYTGTHHINGWEYSEWEIHIPHTVKFKNTTIQSGCPDLMWQGISVNGINDFQLQTEHANIDFQNSSISDAVQAIKTNGEASAIIKNSKFYNNEYDIYIYDAENGSSQIYRNVFETNSRLKNQFKNPTAHVYMYKVRSKIFAGNIFRNSMAFDIPGYDTQNRGTGIYALLSSFVVTPVSSIYNLPTIWAKNTFEGLYYGINAKIECTYAPKINYNTFTNNYRGVHLVAINAPRLLFNNFTNTIDIPPVTTTIGIPVNEEPETNVSYAAYINSCTDFKVEENTVKGIHAGIYVYNTGEASGQQLYRNKFGDNPGSSTYNMYAGTLVVGKNSNWNQLAPPIIHTGLEVRCNNYTSTNFAISVMNGNMRKLQGTNFSSNDQLAGNQFHKYPLVNGMDYTVQIDAVNSEFDLGMYTYWQHSNNTGIVNDYYRELSNFTITKVDPETSTLHSFNPENTCLSHYQFPIAYDELEAIMDDIAVIGTSITSTNELYEELVDRGDKEYMKVIAEDLSRHNFQQYVPILSNEGYLSNEVFETILDNRKAQKPVIAAVLIANSPLPAEIIVMVENSTYLSKGHKKQVRNYQDGMNARVLLEYNIADLEQEKAVKESHLINSAINNDSVPEVKDLIISYLDPQSSDYRKLIKIYGLNLSKQDYSASLANLENIRQLASMPQNEIISDELIKYCDIQELFIASIQDENSLLAHKDMLLEAALDGFALYSATAQVLYEIAADTVFAEYTPLPFEVVQPRKVEISETITQEEYLPLLNVYPNPTDGEINVEYDFAALYTEGNDILLEKLGVSRDVECEKGQLSLYTEDGKLLQQFRLNAVKDSFTISIKDYTPGSYMLVIKDCFGNSETVKITKYR